MKEEIWKLERGNQTGDGGRASSQIKERFPWKNVSRKATENRNNKVCGRQKFPGWKEEKIWQAFWQSLSKRGRERKKRGEGERRREKV